jgi:phage tail-like protein
MPTRVQGGEIAEPHINFRFLVDTIEGSFIPDGEVGFTEVDGLTLGDTAKITYSEGNDFSEQQLMGKTSWPDITLRKGIDQNRRLESWRELVNENLKGIAVRSVTPTGARVPIGTLRATVRIRLIDRVDGPLVVPYREWHVLRAWPRTLTYENLTTRGTGDALMGSVILANEGILLVTPPRR